MIIEKKKKVTKNDIEIENINKIIKRIKILCDKYDAGIIPSSLDSLIAFNNSNKSEIIYLNSLQYKYIIDTTKVVIDGKEMLVSDYFSRHSEVVRFVLMVKNLQTAKNLL